MKKINEFFEFCSKHSNSIGWICFAIVFITFVSVVWNALDNKIEKFSVASTVSFTECQINGSIRETAYVEEAVSMLKVEAMKHGDSFLVKEGEIAQNVMKAFNEKHADNKRALLFSLSITFKPSPEDLAIQQELRSIEKTIKLEEARCKRDSLISVAAKRDAQNYTDVAERLEERRDARYNSKKSLELQEKDIQSNERVEKRKSEAVEKAAKGVGFGRAISITH